MMWIYEHEDGRLPVVAPADAAFLAGDPEWHRVGPCEVHDPVRDALVGALENAVGVMVCDPYWVKDPVVADAVDKATVAIALAKECK